jgi:hypothetical protein
MDGGCTVATLGVRTIDLVSRQFRLFFHYLPAARKKLRFQVGRRWIEEWHMPRPCAFDAASRSEAVRVLDPEPDPVVVDRTRTAVAQSFPIFREAVVAESWGEMIDVMPDAMPVISPVESLPSLLIASGFPVTVSASVRVWANWWPAWSPVTRP